MKCECEAQKTKKKMNNEIYLVMLHLCIANIQIAIRNERFYRFSDENTEKKNPSTQR